MLNLDNVPSNFERQSKYKHRRLSEQKRKQFFEVEK